MEGQICSQLEEIPKSQSKINEELFRFKDEIREEIAKSRAQHEKYMADVHSKFDILIGMVHDRLRSEGIEPPDLVGAPLDQANSNPEGPIDELIPSEDDKGNKSAIKQSIVENGNDPNEMLLLKSARKEEGIEQNNGNVDEEGVWLHLIDLQSVLGSLGDTTVHDSSKGSTKAWFEESTSGLKAVLSQNDIDHVAHKVFDEMSQSFRAVLMDEQVNDPYTNGFNFNNITLFDPGGGRKYAPSFSKGPLISKAHGTYVNGIKGVLSSLRHSIALIDAREKHYVIGSSHFYLSIPGNHATFKLIVDSSVNSELRLERFLFDPGGRFLPQMCCDLFELNGELRDFCFTTNYDASVRVGEYYNDVFSRKCSPISKVVTTLELDVSIQKGITVKALSEEGSKNIYRDMNSFGGNNNVKITRECWSEKLCDEATDETPENAVKLFVYIYDKRSNGQSMSKIKGIVKQLIMLSEMEAIYDALAERVVPTAAAASSSYFKHIIGLVGPPGAGKSIGASQVVKRVNKLWPQTCFSVSVDSQVEPSEVAIVLTMDGFHLNRHQLDAMEDPKEAHAIRGAPWTFNPQLILRCLKTRKKQGSVYTPSFDHGVGDPVEDDIYVDVSHKVVIVEDIYLLLEDGLWKDISSIFDEEWFIDVDIDKAMQRVYNRHISTGKVLEGSIVGEIIFSKAHIVQWLALFQASVASLLHQHFIGMTCSYHIHWLDSWLAYANLTIMSKGAPYVTFVGFLGLVVTTIAGYFLEAIGNRCAIGNGRVNEMNINILARQIFAKLKDFVWDPGLVWVSHFSTLRTRRLLRGRICHVPRLEIRKITEESVGDVGYELLAVNDVIVMSSLYLYRISVI